MNIDVLNKIANQMVDHSKGILAIDESHGTCKKRFDALNIPVNEESRRSYRDMLVSAKSLIIPSFTKPINSLNFFSSILDNSLKHNLSA